MRDTFIELLRQAALKDKNILLVTGDLGFGVLDKYRESIPDQFINAGIAEQNMTGLAAGLSFEDYRVFTYSIGNFCSLRCLEQIRNDICYHNTNVKIISIGSGFGYGSLGMSHHSTEDIAIMRALPNLKIYSPADASEVKIVIDDVISENGPAYIRLGNLKIDTTLTRDVKLSTCNLLSSKSEHASVVVFSTGLSSLLAKKIVEHLPFACDLYTIPLIKPLPHESIVHLTKSKTHVITLEEHNLCGGFGSALGEVLLDNSIMIPLLRLGINNQYVSVGGTSTELAEMSGLSQDKCIEKILHWIKK